ncbi:MAG: hypothetical protein JW717_03490 [Marinilabiliaceae bacterium]|nr:hypothetical protein [Marinilabiliaceae bacterium]
MIYTNKKSYSSPKLTSIKVDREISLVMVSDPPLYESPSVPKAPSNGVLPDKNPFGGASPDYSKM